MSDKVNLTDLQLKIDVINKNNDAFFLVTMSMIIFLMQCGFAFLEAGSVRSKNTTNILIKNMLDSCTASIVYWAAGWAFAFGKPSNPFIGYGQFFMYHGSNEAFNYPKWFFQFVFAATASTIVSGALAERCEIIGYFVYSIVLTGFVYPVLTHWAWDGNGWLADGALGVAYQDFAGSGVVHLHGGVCAFIGAYILGPRLGRFRGDQYFGKVDLRGHSVPFAALGGFILMFGFFAFNGGSQAQITSANDGATVAQAMCVTMLSGGTAGLLALVIGKVADKDHQWSLLVAINAILAGMVAACAGCNVLEPWAAVLTGLGAGPIYLIVSRAVAAVKVDDPLDAVAVHAGGGLWGLVSAPILMNNGIILSGFSEDSFKIFVWNMVGVITILLWSLITIGPLFTALKTFGVLRVAEDVELRGLDIKKHGEAAYPLEAYGHGWPQKFGSAPHGIPLDGRNQRDKNPPRRDIIAPVQKPSVLSIHVDPERYENAEIGAMEVQRAFQEPNKTAQAWKA